MLWQDRIAEVMWEERPLSGSLLHNLRSLGPIQYTKELLCDLKYTAKLSISLGMTGYNSSLFSIWQLNAVMENWVVGTRFL